MRDDRREAGRGFLGSRRAKQSRPALALAALATALVLLGAAGPAEAAPPEPRWVEGRILVQPRAGLRRERFGQILRRAGGRAAGRLRNLGVHVVEVPPQAEARVAAALSRSPHIAFAELDRFLEPEQTIPDDPRYPDAWHLPRIGTPNAWDVSLGDGVTVAVLDTGVDAYHLDLAANLTPGWNSASESTDTSDVEGHGTQVAGVVGALSDNGAGVASVAWNAAIMPIRVTNRSDGWATASAVANGLTWAADHGARVANVSYDVSGSSTVESAAQYMRNKGGLVVAAAGNSGSDPGHGPSAALIAVSATSSNDSLTSWSSYGFHVDFAAPGVGIWTTNEGGGYGSPSGTSFSSPTAAGVVALVMAANGELSPDEVEAVLEQTALDLGDPDWDPYYGFGRVDAAGAVQTAIEAVPSDTESPVVSVRSPTSGETVQGLVAVNVSASDNLGVSRVELYAEGAEVGTDTTAPYEFTWDSTQVGNGDATLVAYGYDAAGNEGRSSDTVVTVDNAGETGGGDDTAPSVTVTSPADGSTVSGNIEIAARASDDGQVAQVKLYVDGALQCAGSPSVSCRWNTRKSGAGSHTVSATAVDDAGNTGEDAVAVSVSGGSKGGGNGKAKGKKK